MNLQEFMKKAERKWGKDIVAFSSRKRVEIPRIPTGIFSLDWALGGGIPIGRISLIYGRKSSGKSNLAQRVIAKSQRLCRKCLKEECKCKYRKFRAAYLDVEGTYNFEWADLLEINHDELLLVRPQFAEQAIDIAEGMMRTGEVDLVVVDSIAAMAPFEEIEESASKFQVGLLARLVNKFIRKSVAVMNEMSKKGLVPTIILINQVRQNIGIPQFMDSEVLPGGMACGFATSVEIRKWAGKYEIRDEEPIYVELFFNITKSKISPPRISGSYYLMLNDDIKKRGEIYQEHHVADLAIKYNLIEQKGHFYSYNGIKFDSKNSLVSFLIENEKNFSELKERLFDVIKI